MNKANLPESPILKAAEGCRNIHNINILDIGNDALLARLHLIRHAKSSVDIQTFILKQDECGVKLLKELYAAALRGVRVRLLIDFWIFHNESSLINLLNVNHKNFEVKLYNPPVESLKGDFLNLVGKGLLDFKGLNQRMHNKTFLVDERVAIVGGRNYDNTYYDRGKTRNFIDLDLMAAGPVVKSVKKSFELFWRSKLSVNTCNFKDVSDESLNRCAEQVNDEYEKLDKQCFSAIDRQADDPQLMEKKFSSRAIRCKDVDLIYDRPGKVTQKNKVSRTSQALQKMIMRAKRTIYVQSPYFVLSNASLKLIKRLRKNNPKLEIVVSTNSLAATDNLYAYAMLYRDKKVYIKDLKIRLFELKPVPEDMPEFMDRDILGGENKTQPSVLDSSDHVSRRSKHMCIHAKAFIVDNDLLWVGTFNADVRSEMINTEIAFIIKSKKIAEIIKRKVKQACVPNNSWTVAPVKYTPVISEINDGLTAVSRVFPMVDLWPFRNVSCFEIKKGERPVPFYTEGFYDRYTQVGPFPQMTAEIKEKEIKTRLIKSFGQVIKPII